MSESGIGDGDADSTSSFANYNDNLIMAIQDNDESNGDDVADNVTITMEKISQQLLSDIWIGRKPRDEGLIYHYKHDEDRNLIVGNEKYLKNAFKSAFFEKVRARELNAMNAREREAINNEIHGVENRSVPETPAMVSSALYQMRREIDENLDQELECDASTGGKGFGSQPLFTKKAYKRGLELRSDYIQSDSYRIRFLRSQLFDVSKAAVIYFRHLDVLHSLFGDAALIRPLFLTDLTKNELRYLRKGQQQLFPSRDHSGRRVYAFLGFNNTDVTAKEKFRTHTYLFDVLSQDETTQRLGYVCIFMVMQSDRIRVIKSSSNYLKRSSLSCPVRCSGFHACCPDSFVVNIVRVILYYFFDYPERPLFCLHKGSQIENNYRLCGYGIPSGDIPLTYDGKVKSKPMSKFIDARKCIEIFQKQQINKLRSNGGISSSNMENLFGNSTNFVIPVCPSIECPDENCVVFGDKSMYEHRANIRFRRFLMRLEQRRLDRIALCDKTVSTSVSGFVDEIIKEALFPQGQQLGLRFFAYGKDHSVYQEITNTTELHKRFLQALRDVRKRSRDQFSLPPVGMVAEQQSETTSDQEPQAVSSLSLEESSILGLDSYKRTKYDWNSKLEPDGNYFTC